MSAARLGNPAEPAEALQALAERRFGDLLRLTASPQTRRKQRAAELETALAHLRTVHASYWERDWRREHRGSGRYPEHYRLVTFVW